ncbi:ElyC/SanA/YdcF family protein [Rapidithrix thailandica]|uniref:ElyC/SanA/YdcF family protein n=1 Tax=Rapidithrix thailandica TaxID=413964 RepID=A0AAW9S2T9_9BACT
MKMIKPTKRKIKKLSWWLLSGGLLCICAILISDATISSYSKACFNSVDQLPHNKVGMLLGTSKYVINGRRNLYYIYRLEAAVQLFQNRKIDYILVSGDNAQMSYNEPQMFKEDLVKRGIPEDCIILDYAGFRTLDSIIRSKKVFGQSKLTVISQPFHNERALFLAEKNDMQAVAFNARDVDTRYGFKVQVREKLARVKCLLDIYVLNTQPKFLGEKINIP